MILKRAVMTTTNGLQNLAFPVSTTISCINEIFLTFLSRTQTLTDIAGRFWVVANDVTPSRPGGPVALIEIGALKTTKSQTSSALARV